jgi:hypothetical protein
MTSTSLIFSDRYGDCRAVELEALNFAWAAGATLANPASALFAYCKHSFILPRSAGTILVVISMGSDSRAMRCISNYFEEIVIGRVQASQRSDPLILMAICAVGIDSSLSGWRTTYSHRADALNIGRQRRSSGWGWLSAGCLLHPFLGENWVPQGACDLALGVRGFDRTSDICSVAVCDPHICGAFGFVR